MSEPEAPPRTSLQSEINNIVKQMIVEDARHRSVRTLLFDEYERLLELAAALDPSHSE